MAKFKSLQNVAASAALSLGVLSGNAGCIAASDVDSTETPAPAQSKPVGEAEQDLLGVSVPQVPLPLPPDALYTYRLLCEHSEPVCFESGTGRFYCTPNPNVPNDDVMLTIRPVHLNQTLDFCQTKVNPQTGALEQWVITNPPTQVLDGQVINQLQGSLPVALQSTLIAVEQYVVNPPPHAPPCETEKIITSLANPSGPMPVTLVCQP